MIKQLQTILPIILMMGFFTSSLAQEPVISFIPKAEVGTKIEFKIARESDDAQLLIDWGDGQKIDTESDSYYPVPGTIVGSEIKIYGEGIHYFSINKVPLTSFDVSKCLGLKTLYVQHAELSTIDVTKNTALEDLSLYQNNLETLDLTNNIALLKMNVAFNEQLKDLNVSQNTLLHFFVMDHNEALETIDLSNLPNLNSFFASYTNLVSLDLTNNTKLGILSCQKTESLKTVKLNSAALKKINLCDGLLETLDLATCTGLYELNVNNNKISSLDVTGLKNLDLLYCSGNNLQELNVSNNTKLTKLKCGNKDLKELDVTSNTKLKYLSLYCEEKGILSELNLSNNTQLEELIITNNSLDQIDISNNLEIKNIYCGKNYLNSLDLSNNTKLTTLYCQENNFTFNTLPVKQPTWTSYSYGTQNPVALPEAVAINKQVDLSNVGDEETTYKWITSKYDDLIEGTDYTIANGVTTFLKTQYHSVKCIMKNPNFPQLTLSTTNTNVVTSTDIENTEESNLKIYSHNNQVIIETSKTGTCQIFNLSGQLIKECQVQMGTNSFNIATSGIYLVRMNNKCQKIRIQ